MTPARYKLLSLVLALLVLLIDVQVPLGVACGILYTGVVLVSEFSGEPAFIRRIAVLSTVLTVLGYYGSPEGDAVPWMVVTNRVLSIYVIWVTAILSTRILKRHAEELRSLTGLLPICAWCKNIRDDKGYWNQLESWLATHTGADFSHSICPSCMQLHFPDDGGGQAGGDRIHSSHSGSAP